MLRQRKRTRLEGDLQWFPTTRPPIPVQKRSPPTSANNGPCSDWTTDTPPCWTPSKALGEAEAFLGSRWSVWEVMQHLLTESFVEALEQIASGEREMLPPFDPRNDRIAADVAKLEANYQRFRRLISG